MRLKGLFRGHPKISKKSKNTSLGLKLEELCIVKVDHFWKIAKSQMCSKMYFLPKGPSILGLYLVKDMVHDPNQHPYLIFSIYLFYFDLYLLKITLNQINNKKCQRLF